MSLVILVKNPLGLVFSADTRLTFTVDKLDHGVTVRSEYTYDHGSKLFSLKNHPYVGILTFNRAILADSQPRAVHSYIAELDEYIGTGRKSLMKLAESVGTFFSEQMKSLKCDMSIPIEFLIGGYDENFAYPSAFHLSVADGFTLKPLMENYSGIHWGGQHSIVNRTILGFEPGLLDVVSSELSLSAEQTDKLRVLFQGLQLQVPWDILPIQDCVNLCRELTRLTISVQSLSYSSRGVGGDVDVAIVTREGGFRFISERNIT